MARPKPELVLSDDERQKLITAGCEMMYKPAFHLSVYP